MARKYIAENIRKYKVTGRRNGLPLVTMTLRRAIPKVRGKAARKADKRARQAARRTTERLIIHETIGPETWDVLKRQLEACDYPGRDVPAQADEQANTEPDRDRVERDVIGHGPV